MFITLQRIIAAGFKGFYRNFTISISAILIMVISLLSFAGIYLISELLKPSIENLENKVDINLYFNPEASEGIILELKDRIEKIDQVERIDYTTKEQALEIFKQDQDDEFIAVLDSIGENPLGAAFNIKAREISQYEEIADFLDIIQASDEYSEVIESVNYHQLKLAIEKLSTTIKTVQSFGLVISIFLVALSILITYNTIRLAIYTARNEVAVMRLVGASKFFARGPFIVEGIFYGFAAGVVSLLILWPALYYAAPFLREIFILDIYQFFLTKALFITGSLLLAGMCLGAISSLLAIRRYLDI